MILFARVICGVAGLVVLMTAARADTRGLYSRNDYCLLSASRIPLLLPTRLAAQIGSVRSITVITADRSSYYVGYSNVASCRGGLSCATLHVAGYLRSSIAGQSYGTDRRIVLPDRSIAYYAPSDCSGSSCVESALTFARHNVIYEIDTKASPALPALLDVYRRLQPSDPHEHCVQGR